MQNNKEIKISTGGSRKATHWPSMRTDVVRVRGASSGTPPEKR